MKTFIVGLLTVFALVGSYGSPAALTIKFGTLAPERSPWYDLIRDMAEAWKTASGGTVKVRIYAGGIAGDEPDMVRKMKVGQLRSVRSVLGRVRGAIRGVCLTFGPSDGGRPELLGPGKLRHRS